MDLTLTPNAVRMVQGFLKEHGDTGEAGTPRPRFSPGAARGFQYGVDIDNGPDGDDEILIRDGIRIFVDPFSAQYLEGIEIDYITSADGFRVHVQEPAGHGRMWLRQFVHGVARRCWKS